MIKVRPEIAKKAIQIFMNNFEKNVHFCGRQAPITTTHWQTWKQLLYPGGS